MSRWLNRAMTSSPKFRKTFIRAWRKRIPNLTLEKVADRMEQLATKRKINKRSVITTASGLSMLENGQRRYTQETLELLAEVLQTDVASLLTRDPGDGDTIWAVWQEAKPGQRRQIVEIAKTLIRTGT